MPASQRRIPAAPAAVLGDATDGVVKECILPKPGANKILVNASAILQDSVEPMSLVVWSEWI